MKLKVLDYERTAHYTFLPSPFEMLKNVSKPKDTLDNRHLAHQFHSYLLEVKKLRNYNKKNIKKLLNL